LTWPLIFGTLRGAGSCEPVRFGGYQIGDNMKVYDYEMKHGILTVGRLRELLALCDECDHVLIGSPSGWERVSDWLNVEGVTLPNSDNGYEGFTLFSSDTFDPRQF